MGKIKVRTVSRVAVMVAEPGVSINTRRRHKFTPEELLDALVGLCNKYNRVITRDDVKAASRAGTIPSEDSIRRYLGAVDIAVVKANKVFRSRRI